MKIKILFIIPALTGGGAEKVIVSILKYIDREKFIPVLALIKKIGPFVEDIPPDVKLIDLKCQSTKGAVFKIIQMIWTEKPQVVMSTLGHLNLIIAIIRFLLPKNIYFIARESNIISLHNKNEKHPRLFDFLFKSVYKNFDTIICQSKSMKDDLVENYLISEDIIEIINNPVDFDKIETLKTEDTASWIKSSNVNFLAVGRLTKQKSFSRLIKVFSMTRNVKNRLLIMGEGEEKNILGELIDQYGLKDRVKIIPFQKNPYKFMHHVDCLLITSHYEGLPNVVLEANACGTPVLGFATPGVVDVIVPGLNGWLIKNNDFEDLSNKIDLFHSNSFNKKHIIENAYSRYNIKQILSQYEKLFLRRFTVKV